MFVICIMIDPTFLNVWIAKMFEEFLAEKFTLVFLNNDYKFDK